MTRVQALLEQVKRLSSKERQELATKLRGSLKTTRARRSKDVRPYASLLEIAGTADSDFRDVSSNKQKHVGEIYARHRS